MRKMKKIEKEMLSAIEARISFRKDNTQVEVLKDTILVKLYGNIIAKLDKTNSSLSISTAGWATITTVSRLRAIVGSGYRVNLRKGEVILSKIGPDNKVLRSTSVTSNLILVN